MKNENIQDFKAKHPTACRDLLVELGAVVRKQGADKVLCSCWNKSNHKHGDVNNPSMVYFPKDDKAMCYVCMEKPGDYFDWIAYSQGISDRKEVYKRGFERLNYGSSSFEGKPTVSQPVTKVAQQPVEGKTGKEEKDLPIITHPEKVPGDAYFKECEARLDEILDSEGRFRGISRDTLRRYRAGYDPAYCQPHSTQPNRTPCIIFPVTKTTYFYRSTVGKFAGNSIGKARYENGEVFEGEGATWNRNAIFRERFVFVCEAIFDALSFVECGFSAVGMLSQSNWPRLLREAAGENRAGCTFIIALDNEQGTEKNRERMLAAFRKEGFRIFAPDPATLFCGWKDANEALQKNRKEFDAAARDCLAKVKDAVNAEYYASSVGGSLDRFIKWANTEKPAFPTGIKEWDGLQTNGGVRAGLILFGALPGMGKTTLCQQVAWNFIKAGHDVFFYALEMSDNDLISKDLSRLTFEYSLDHKEALYSSAIANAYSKDEPGKLWSNAQRESFNRAIEEYRNATVGHFWYHTPESRGEITVETIAEDMRKHRELTGRSPIVFVDYLQLLSLPEKYAAANLTDKQRVDLNMKHLIGLWKEHEVPIITISSMNRVNYREPFRIEALKESGGAEYGADAIFGLQYEGVEYQFDKNGKPEPNNERHARLETQERERIENDNVPGVPVKLQIKIVKNRHGKRGIVSLEFYKAFSYFQQGKESQPNEVDYSNSPVQKVEGSVPDYLEAALGETQPEEGVATL